MVEVVVALLILAVGVLGLQTVTTRYLQVVTTSDRQAVALQLVRDRLDQVRTDPEYTQLRTRYQATETDLPDLPGLTRTTVVNQIQRQVGDGTVDFTKVTVTVSGTGLSAPVARSLSVGAP
jgi:type IV pilus modification protein PilV